MRGKYVLADVICYWKMMSFMALDCETSYLRLTDVTNTCEHMRRSLSIGGSSSVQWLKVGRSWSLWSPAGKGLGSRLWCLLWVCHFPIGILGQVWYLIVSIPDLCNLTSNVFRRLLCVRIEIDQLYCVNCWVIIHCLSVSCTKMNQSRYALVIWSS